MTKPVVHPYLPNSAPASKQAMLAAIGAADIDEFFADIPKELCLDRPLNLPPALAAEEELRRYVRGILKQNLDPDQRLAFLGQGTYPHTVPAVVTEVINRGEFLTAYAGEPYEDHGRFQALFEYASQLGELLSCDVVTVPTYDGFQATSTALAMAARITGKNRILQVSQPLPDKLTRVADFLLPLAKLEVIPTADGVADLAATKAALADDVAAIWVETPSRSGAIEQQLAQLADLAHSVGALLVVATDPIIYGVLEPPAGFGADITCGDIQSLGLGQWFGGAHAGFLAMADDPKLVMELPSRLFGLTSTTVAGEYGFGDVAFERTSFALREDGKEWVGTAAALWGVAAGVYLSLMGPQGMADIGETLALRTGYAQQLLSAIDGLELADGAYHIREFALRTDPPAAELVTACRLQGIEPGVATDEHELVVCVTEQHTAADIEQLRDGLATAVKEA
ncbi:MAG: aminomethyl-transferring glycine dehydrogenase [Actinomycetales bacterium]|nr:MAG: aminomethyl-transferring glycine dehydrogenase [Actinomycetales bacterium]